MAKSEAHILGEFIGAFFEDTMKAPFRKFAEQNNLYFDSFGARKARKGKKVSWTDIHDSKHDLDFVIEKGGTEDKIGEPIAFIELAWRSYKKHSKNKVQEIAGAVNPICEKYQFTKPFKGAILCGQFTSPSIAQLQKDNFTVLYIPFEKIVQAFGKHGLDVNFDETTKESDIKKKNNAITLKSNHPIIEEVRQELLQSCEKEINQFIDKLSVAYSRKITKICVLPLHGTRTEVTDVKQAISFIHNYNEIPTTSKLEYIEIIVTYNNNSIIQCHFKEKDEAIEFLNHIR